MRIFRNVFLPLGVVLFVAGAVLTLVSGNKVNAEFKIEENEPNNSVSTANTIEIGSVYSGVCGTGDNDYFKLVVEYDSVIKFRPGGGDHKFTLYDSNNVFITDYSSFDAITYKFEKGTYYLKVSYDPNYGLGADYTIEFESYGCEPDEPFSDFNDSKEDAADIEFGKTYNALLAANDLNDWYKFTFDKDDDLYISFDWNFSFDVYLENENGDEIGGLSYDGGYSQKYELTAGTYYLHFKDSNTRGGGTYSFTLHYYTVSVQIEGEGNVDISPDCGTIGTKISLLAFLTDGYKFKGYELVSGDVTDYQAFGLGADFKLDKSDVVVKAVFEKIPVTATPTPKSKPSNKPSKPTATPSSKPTANPTAKPTKASGVSLTLDRNDASVICGDKLSLKATLKGSSAKVTWKSSDTKVATVDSSGKVTAKMAGTANITASAAGKSVTCSVTVLYKDVTNSKDFWYAPTNYLTAGGVVKGYDKQTKFKPANMCTRAQMVTFIWRLQGEPEPKAKTCKFSDVKLKDYFYKACIWGNENHIVEGYKDGTFGPQIVCARKHAVTFLWRLAKQPSPKSKENKFKDVKKGDYFYTATLWASEKGILAGYSDGTFRPNGDCLRRQMVTFLYKYDKFVNKKG